MFLWATVTGVLQRGLGRNKKIFTAKDAKGAKAGNLPNSITQLLNFPITQLPNSSSLFHGNAQGLHLPVEVAAFQAEHLGCAGHVAVVFIEFLQDVVALVGGAGLVEG